MGSNQDSSAGSSDYSNLIYKILGIVSEQDSVAPRRTPRSHVRRSIVCVFTEGIAVNANTTKYNNCTPYASPGDFVRLPNLRILNVFEKGVGQAHVQVV